MTIETASYPASFDVNLPRSTDLLKEGDDHIRLVKSVLRATFPNMTGVVNITSDMLNGLNSTFTMAGGTTTINRNISVAVNHPISVGNNRITNVGQSKPADLHQVANNDLQTFAMLKAMFRAMYPVNSVFCTGINSANPSTLPYFQNTTWVAIAAGMYVAGGVPTGGDIGGATSFTLTADNFPAHNHVVTINNGGSTAQGTSANGNHYHQDGWGAPGARWTSTPARSGTNNHGDYGKHRTNATGNHSHTVNFGHTHNVKFSAYGSTAAISTTPAYTSFYFWRRTDTKGIWDA